jgi:hypothetical protein
MAKFTLSNHGLMALGIYIGHKAAFRRKEMESFGLDYEKALQEFHQVGLMKSRKMDMAQARAAFKERIPSGLGSQTHQYCKQLGYERLSYY